MENNFVCFTCQKKPVEFTILECDHLICSTCIDRTLVNLSEISMVQCQCGLKTYCTEDSMRMSLKTPQMIGLQRQLEKLKRFENQNTEISNFVIHQSDFSSKDNTFFRNKENINTQNHYENQKYSFNPSAAYSSKYFLKTQPLNIDSSNPFLVQETENGLKKIIKGVRNVDSIKTGSPSQKISEGVSPRRQRSNKTPKKLRACISSSNVRSSSDSLNSLAKQLQKQLKFVSIQHEKQLETCRKMFKKVIQTICYSYEKVVSSLQKFYLQQIVEIEQSQKDQILMNLPKMVKKKYDSNVGCKISKLNQRLMDFFQQLGAKKTSERQRVSRQTVFVTKDITLKQDNYSGKSSTKKSKSKVKQCSLYLALSPKQKNHKMVNYIQVINRQSQKVSTKSNLIKKTLKGERIRLI